MPHVLESAANKQDENKFLRIYQGIEWAQRPADEIVLVIKLALSAGVYLVARDLAMKGTKKFPGNKELQNLSHLLAPPKVSVSKRAPEPGIRANRDWLKHNRTAYQGRWVALYNGSLLSVADSMDEVVAEVGEVKNKGILITRVY